MPWVFFVFKVLLLPKFKLLHFSVFFTLIFRSFFAFLFSCCSLLKQNWAASSFLLELQVAIVVVFTLRYNFWFLLNLNPIQVQCVGKNLCQSWVWAMKAYPHTCFLVSALIHVQKFTRSIWLQSNNRRGKSSSFNPPFWFLIV